MRIMYVLTLLVVAAGVLAVLRPRSLRRAMPRAGLTLIAVQPVSLLAAPVLWSAIGAMAAACAGMAGVACMMAGVSLMPRDDPWFDPPRDDDDGHGGDGPPHPDGGGTDWTEFDRARRDWEIQSLLA